MKLDLDIKKSVKRRVDTRFFASYIKDFLKFMQLDGYFTVEVMLVGNRRIHNLNKKYRGVDKPTDVMSFPIKEKVGQQALPFIVPQALGTVVVAVPYARAKKLSIIELVLHGMMHLIGNDHESEPEFDRWEKTFTQFWLRHKRRHTFTGN